MKKRFFQKFGPRAKRTILVFALIVVLLVGGVTVSYALRDTTGEVTETLEKAEVTCEVNEDWSVTNTGNIPALIRVRVVVNLVDEDTLLPGDVPTYTVGSDWERIGNYLYYNGIVNFEDGENATTPAIAFSPNADQQVRVTVLADAIQATPADAAQSAWGKSYSDGSWS